MSCNHTQGPSGYVARMNWLEWMSKRYTQVKCDKCRLWAIWRSKVSRTATEGNNV